MVQFGIASRKVIATLCLSFALLNADAAFAQGVRCAHRVGLQRVWCVHAEADSQGTAKGRPCQEEG
ncbi:hypothetical protein P3T21_002896 [Paraburkholderia sp. GAS334]